MFKHRCSIKTEGSNCFLPPVKKRNCFKWLLRCLKKSTLISEYNPRCGEFYQSLSDVLALREAQVAANSIIIHPFSIFCVYYEMWMLAVLFITLIYIPMDAAFDDHSTNKQFRHINLFINLINLIDVFMRFIKGYANPLEKEVVMDPWKIAKRYLTSVHFIPDVLASIPDPHFYSSNWLVVRIIDLLALAKITRITTTFRYLTRTGQFLSIKNSGRARAVKLFVCTFIIFHWIACTLFAIPTIRIIANGKIDSRSWIKLWHLDHASMSTQYAVSFYRASGYLICIWFDEFSKTMGCWEDIMAVGFCYCLGKIFISLLTVVVLRMLLERRTLELKYQELMAQVESFMRLNKLPKRLRDKILQNYRYKYNNTYFREHEIAGLLSDQLKKEINSQQLSVLTEDVPLFQGLSQFTLAIVLSHLKSEIFLPNDIIVKAGTPGDCMYFLASGTVCVTTPSGKEVCHLHDGAYFGEICLVLNQKTRTATVLALEICEVYKMTRKGFLSCFKDFGFLWKRLRERALERMELTQIYEDIYVRAMDEKQTQLKKSI